MRRATIALICMYKDRGLFSKSVIISVAFIAASYGLLYAQWQSGQLINYLTSLPISLIEMQFDDYFLSEGATGVFAVAILFALLFLMIRKTNTEAVLLVSLFMSSVMLAAFDKPLISALFVSANLLSIVYAIVQNSYRMAFIDELTGIPARRALQDKLASLGKTYTLAMCDIDHFKKFNDTYGHDVGDQVLKLVASKLNQVSGGGKAYRYGGEEFTLVFPGKNEEEALPYIEQLRETIANYPMQIRRPERPKSNEKGEKMRASDTQNEVVHITISIGACEKRPEYLQPQDVIKKADEALYASKDSGRNCTTVIHNMKPKAARRRKHDYA